MHGIEAQPTSHVFPNVEGHTIDRELGQGGMGTVYRARNQASNELVALKMLKRVDGAGIYRMKREFRLLADIVHSNLVRLIELYCGDEHWFFTMELIEGQPFLDHLGVERGIESPVSMVAFDAPTESSWTERLSGQPPVGSPFIDEPRFRMPFLQLAEGLGAVHRASRLHCDVKPSNILAANDGRIVVLDFGVSVNLKRDQELRTLEGEIGGTPEYMSPEQAAGRSVGPPSDWYAFGVVLYEALCGRLPFAGPRLEVMRRKQDELPRRPSALRGGIPVDLEELCMALLAANPADRPTGSQVLAAMQPSRQPVEIEPVEPLESRFVGRNAELEQLRAAWNQVRALTPVLTFVTGKSGIGKSTLVHEFLADAAKVSGCVVLRGRCYERESVPYKAFDPIVDELSRFLRRLSDREVAELLPRDMTALSRVFPVFPRVRAVAIARGRTTSSDDLVELRRRASNALKELLARIADVWKLVIFIDDAQWGDEDSVRLLAEVLEPPDAPSVFVILGARPDEDSAMLRELLHGRSAKSFLPFMRWVKLRALEFDEATALAETVVGSEQRELARVIAREAAGNPLFVRELSLYAQKRLDAQPSGSPVPMLRIGLDTMLKERLEQLPPIQREALELVAVASQPLPQALLLAMLGESKALGAGFRAMQAAHLARLVGTPGSRLVECYHDRVREGVLANLTPARLAACHRLLAEAFRRGGDADPEVLLEHYQGAGDAAGARQHVIVSARAAAEALAFSRAARLYQLAIELLPEESDEAMELHRSLGRVLAHDGRLQEAAIAYEHAAERAEGTVAIDLRRISAQHFLTSGNEEAGVRVLRRALKDVELSYPTTPGAGVVRLMWERAKLRFGNMKFAERADPTPAELLQVDVCFSAAVGMAMTDLLRTAAFSAQHLNLALRAGEPGRIARGLAFEMGIAPGAGDEGMRWASRALPVVKRLSEEHGSAYHRGLFFLAQGHVAYLSAQWKAAVDWLARAEGLLRESQTPDLHWALLSGHVLSLVAAVAAGEYVSASQRTASLFSEARHRGETHRLALMSYPGVLLELAHDRPDAAAELVREITRPERPDTYDLRHFTALHCSLLVERYNHQEAGNWEQIEAAWPAIERSKLLVVNIVRVTALAERGSAALAQASRRGATPFLRVATQAARKLAAENLPHAAALGGLLLARIAWLKGDTSRALASLTEVSLRLDTAGLSAHADCARRVAAVLMGGSMGELLRAEADQHLMARGVRDPARFAALMVPGFTGREGPAAD